MTNFFENLRAGFAFVAAQAEHVTIQHERLADYARSIAAQDLPDTFDEDHHYVSGQAEHDYGYVLLLDSVNFGSGYSAALREEGTLAPSESFYFTMAARLKKRFETRPVTPQEAADLCLEDVMHVFGFKDRPQSRELAGLYHQALNEMGQMVAADYNSFEGFIAATQNSAATCINQLLKCPLYRDAHSYHGREIGFYKRAQITAADLHLTAQRTGQDLFRDIDLLTMFADNAVPHVLRQDGLLQYSAALAGKISQGEPLSAGSAEEIEIRACAAHVVECIAAATGMIAMDIDHRLWHRSEREAYKKGRTHITKTVFY